MYIYGVIFMEDGDEPLSNFDFDLKFLSFIYSKGYKPQNFELKDLKKEGWKEWPWNIIWLRNDKNK